MAEKKIKLAPVHPGEILREDFMAPLGLSINAVPSAGTIFWHDGGTLAWTATGLRIGPGPRYGRCAHPKRGAPAGKLAWHVRWTDHERQRIAHLAHFAGVQ